jgi:hypothetical protein
VVKGPPGARRAGLGREVAHHRPEHGWVGVGEELRWARHLDAAVTVGVPQLQGVAGHAEHRRHRVGPHPDDGLFGVVHEVGADADHPVARALDGLFGQDLHQRHVAVLHRRVLAVRLGEERAGVGVVRERRAQHRSGREGVDHRPALDLRERIPPAVLAKHRERRPVRGEVAVEIEAVARRGARPAHAVPVDEAALKRHEEGVLSGVAEAPGPHEQRHLLILNEDARRVTPAHPAGRAVAVEVAGVEARARRAVLGGPQSGADVGLAADHGLVAVGGDVGQNRDRVLGKPAGEVGVALVDALNPRRDGVERGHHAGPLRGVCAAVEPEARALVLVAVVFAQGEEQDRPPAAGGAELGQRHPAGAGLGQGAAPGLDLSVV